MKRFHNTYGNHDWIATPRELVFSIFLIGVLVSVFCSIHGCIRDKITDHNLKIQQAIKIESNEEFSHCLSTSPGDAFCEGDLYALDSVDDDKGLVEGKFWSIRREYQEYKEHEYYTEEEDEDGHTYRVKHTYWSWDCVGFPTLISCSKISFCGEIFSLNKIRLDCIGSIVHKPIGYRKRYEYITIPVSHHGTIYTTFSHGSIKDGSNFFSNKKPEEVYDSMLVGYWVIYVFWFITICVILIVVYMFLIIDNRWLESKNSKKKGINIGGYV